MTARSAIWSGCLAFDDRQGRDVDLLAQDAQLLLRGRAARIERGHQTFFLSRVVRRLSQLGRGGGLTGALQADHHDATGGVAARLMPWASGAQHRTSASLTILTTIWPGVTDLTTSAPTAFSFTDSVKLLHHIERHVGLDQGAAHFAQRQTNAKRARGRKRAGGRGPVNLPETRCCSDVSPCADLPMTSSLLRWSDHSEARSIRPSPRMRNIRLIGLIAHWGLATPNHAANAHHALYGFLARHPPYTGPDIHRTPVNAQRWPTHCRTQIQAHPFRKMNGLGNDFIIVDGRASGFRADETLVRAMASRDGGIGCDQYIVLEPVSGQVGKPGRRLHAHLQHRWQRGRRLRQCHPLRCGHPLGRTDGRLPEASKPVPACSRPSDCDDGQVTINMGKPRFDWDDIPLAEKLENTAMLPIQMGPIDAPLIAAPFAVNVGNPARRSSG
jgi:hypothetical protein